MEKEIRNRLSDFNAATTNVAKNAKNIIISSPTTQGANRKQNQQPAVEPAAILSGSNGKPSFRPNRDRAGSSGSNINYDGGGGDGDDSDYDDDEDVVDDDSIQYEEEEYSSPSKAVAQFDLCGSMYKRRGGLGRNRDRNWVMRTFTLYGPILCYHEEPAIESVTDPSKPRARLNLSKTETIAEMHSKRKPGLPTEDLLTINIYDPIIHSKKKWEMCCTSKEQQLVWYKAINEYNGKPQEKEAGENNVESPGCTRIKSMPDLSTDGMETRPLRPIPRFGGGGGGGGGAATMLDDVELVAKAAARAAEIMEEKQSQQKKTLSKFNVAFMIGVLNAAFYFGRHGSEQTYKITLFFVNAFVLHLAFRHSSASKSNKTSRSRGPKARAAKSKKRKITNAEGSKPSTPTNQSQITNDRDKSFAKSLPAGRTIPRAPPKENSDVERQLQTCEPDSAQAARIYASAPGASIETQPHSYSNVDAKLFHLRIGPNYKKNKRKAPSGPALYDLISMDFLYADEPLRNVADKFRIPHIPGLTDVSTGHKHIPPVLVINTWLPGEEPSMFGGKSANEGETYSIPMVFVLSKDTLGELRDLESASAGVKLLSEWCEKAETDSDFRGRFKCMGMVENIESSGVPKFIQGYNGKPALVTKSGTFKRHSNYIEFTINVNMWAYLARKGLYTLTPTFPGFIFNVGFTIEARKDEEMPEVLLGGCRLLNLDPEKAVVDGVDDVEI